MSVTTAEETFGEINLKSLFHWLKARLAFGPLDHSRDQGTVERFGGQLQEMLAKLCKAWPDHWDEYVSPACLLNRIRQDSSLPFKITSIELGLAVNPERPLTL